MKNKTKRVEFKIDKLEEESPNWDLYKERVQDYQTRLDRGHPEDLNMNFIKVICIRKDDYDGNPDEHYADFGLLKSGSSLILGIHGFYNELHTPISLTCPNYFQNHDIFYLNMLLEKCYIRLGDIPSNEKSFNHLDKIYEDGVSTFRGIKYNNCYVPIIEYPDKAGTILPLQAMFDYCKKPTYIVTGEEVGLGSDGEPLLRNVNIIKEIEPKQYHIQLKSNTINEL